MSIETELKSALLDYAERTKRPASLDAEVEGAYVRYTGSLQRPHSRMRRIGAKRLAIIAAASLLLLSGAAYASGLLIKLQSGAIGWELSTDAALQLDDREAAAVRRTVEAVRTELAPGESAYVFVAALDARKLPALLKVTHPQTTGDIGVWQERISEAGLSLPAPAALTEQFRFIRGELQAPLGTTDPETYASFSSLLRRQAGGSKQHYAWRKAEPSAAPAPYSFAPGLIYANANGEQLEVRYEPIPAADRKLDVKLKTDPAASMEKVTVGGMDAIYSVNRRHLFSPTGYMQDITWIERHDGRDAVYHVSSASELVPRDALLNAAEQLAMPASDR